MTDPSSPSTGSQPSAGSKLTRRRFISGLSCVIVTAATGLLVTPGIKNLVGESDDTGDGWLTLCSLAALTPGRPSGFPFARRRSGSWGAVRQTGVAYAVTPDGQTAQVFSNICTHAACRVAWLPEQNRYVCPCHRGAYGPDGSVLAGLPPAPLEQFPTRVVHGLVQILLEL